MTESLFRLHQVLSAKDVRLAARCESGNRELLAFVSGCGRLTLCYNESRDAKTTVKVIPWFQDTCKRIAALSFDPTCTWLLAAGRDGSLYVVPALALVAPSLVLDSRWSNTDLTLVAEARTTGSAVALAWWHCQMECAHVGVLAMSCGDIVLVNLAEPAKVGAANIGKNITDMRICQDPYLDAAFILVSDSSGQQWRLVLEQRSTGFSWPLVSVNNTETKPDPANHNTLGVPTARSRLHGLKQLSVEKLASLRQRLAESRTRGGKDSPEPRNKTPEQTRRGSTGSSSDDCKDWTVVRPMAEQLSPDTLLLPQLYRRRSVVTAMYRSKNILTIHPMKLESGIPLSAHKLAAGSEEVLLTDNFMFVADLTRQQLTVVSTAFSECRLDGDAEQNPDSVLDQLYFHGEEKIISVFRLSGCEVPSASDNTLPEASEAKDEQTKSNSEQNKPKEERRKKDEEKARGKEERRKADEEIKRPKEDRRKGEDDKRRERRSRSRGKEEAKKTQEFCLPSCVADMQVERKPVDTCVVVTTAGVYKLILKRDSVEMFMELVLERGELEKGERLAQVLRLDLQRLLELAGDLQLARCRFRQATQLYKLSRCRHLKSVLKLAAVGNSAALLRYVEDLLAVVGSTELSASERIHLANLAVMAHADLVLRADAKQLATDRFINFLSSNQCYDQVLAVNVAGQTRLWRVLCYLSSQRGLHPELLDTLTRVLGALVDAGLHPDAPALDDDLWLACSEPALLMHMLAKPRQCSQHLHHIRLCMSHLPRSTLTRLADMLDPTSVEFRPTLRKMFKAQVNHEEPMSLNIGSEVVLVYLLVLSRLVPAPRYSPCLLPPPTPAATPRREAGSSRGSVLAAGFQHAALVRNAGLYTWGGVQTGCLGTGPTVSRFQPAQPVQALTGARVEVLTVSCGRSHTLALTNNGVYAWGSNQFGQLGIGRSSQTSWPRAVTALSDEDIVQVAAGQYHSLALTADGRVYSWGWAVHGQLGTGSIEDSFTPRPVPLLPPATAIAAGHAHSLALSRAGTVHAFGSAMFGQLGTGSLVKQTRPVLVAGLVEPVVNIATGYFHNFVLTSSGQLYTWGLSPQSLRLQVQAHKKQRLLHKHAANHVEAEVIPTSQSDKEVIPANGSEGETTTTNQNQAEETESLVKIVISDDKSAVTEESLQEGERRGKTENQSQSRTEDSGQSEERKHSQTEAPAYLVEDTSHGHVVPSLVDTSLVTGNIIQVSAGGHHSALVTDEGFLYTWGRNLEGQLGCGGRREVIRPTRLTTLEPFGDKTTVKEVACGSEFTLALTSSRSARVLAWGCNSSAQLGTAPMEDGKALDGKIVMIKTVKRVIKLPHGSNNAVMLPREVPGLGSVSITFRSHAHGAFSDILHAVKRDIKGLHYLLCRLHGRYNSAALSAALLELNHFQLAGALASLEQRPVDALRFHLRAVEISNQPVEIENTVEHDTQLSQQQLNLHTEEKNTLNVSKLPENQPEDVPNVSENLEQQLNTHTEEKTCENLTEDVLKLSKDLLHQLKLHSEEKTTQNITKISENPPEDVLKLSEDLQKKLNLHTEEIISDNVTKISVNLPEDISNLPAIMQQNLQLHTEGNASENVTILSENLQEKLNAHTEGLISGNDSILSENLPDDVLKLEIQEHFDTHTEEITSKETSLLSVELQDISKANDKSIQEVPETTSIIDVNVIKETLLSEDKSSHGDILETEKENSLRDVTELEEKPFVGFHFPGGLVNAVKHFTLDVSEMETKINDKCDETQPNREEVTTSPEKSSSKSTTDLSQNPIKHLAAFDIIADRESKESVAYEEEKEASEGREMHAFSVQGGTEEMSEGGSTVTTPSDSLSAPPITPADDQPDNSETEVNQNEPTIKENQPEISDIETSVNESQPTVKQNEPKISEVNKNESKIKEIQPEISHVETRVCEVNENQPTVKQTEPKINEFDVNDLKISEVSEKEPTINNVNNTETKITESELKINESVPKVIESLPKGSENEPIINETVTKCDESDGKVSASDVDSAVEAGRLQRLATQAAEVVDYFLQTEEGPLLADMLAEALVFWRRLHLPVEPLEALLSARERVFYSLGTIMFKESGAEGPGPMLDRFSAQFCLRVCSHLTTHIDLDKPHPELLDLLRTAHGPNGCSPLPVPSLGPSH